MRCPAPRLRFCLMAAAALLGGCTGQAAPQPGAAKVARPPPLVSVVTARTADLAVEHQAQGHLVALNSVLVRPQLSAKISKVHFREGERVAAGQLLFTLDAADALAQLERASAQQAQIEAQFESARRDYQRAEALVGAQFVAPSTLDTARSKLDGLRAQQRGAAAEVAAAQVALDHLRIVAPIAARTGAIGLHAGGLARPGAAEPLVTLIQLDPIGVEFALPEQLLPAILAAQARKPLGVTLEAADGQRYQGSLAFIDSSVDRASGTISLKASFANPAERLWPGTFARITLHAGSSRQAATLPPQSVQEGPRGRFVYLLDGAGRVKTQPVTLLRIQDNQAIVGGLRDGQRVIAEGAAGQLRDGAEVRIAAGAEGARQ
jgi:RND family efflux transporter MFP subunit